MRITGLLLGGLIAVTAAGAQAQTATQDKAPASTAPATAQGAPQEKAPAAAQETTQDQALLGTYTQRQACKGDGNDPIRQIVRIGESATESNFGVCTYSNKIWNGNALTVDATCKTKSGSEIEVRVVFTPKPDKTVDFVEELSQYKSVLYRCPDGAKMPK